MPKTGTSVSARMAQRVEDAAVAAQDDADVRPLAVVHRARCLRRPLRACWCSSGVEISCTAASSRPSPPPRPPPGCVPGASAGCVCVISIARVMARPPAGRHRDRPPPRSAQAQTKVSRFPFGPGRPEDPRPRTTKPSACAASATSADRVAAIGGVAHDASFPTFSLPSSNCGFTSPSRSNSAAGGGD